MESEYESVSNSADASEKQLEQMRTQMHCTQVKVTLELMIGSSHSKTKDALETVVSQRGTDFT